MQNEEQLLELERRFWLGDADYFRRNLTDDALMVFAEPIGALTFDKIIETISAGSRWTDVQLDEVRVLPLSDQAVLMTYRAKASRGGEDFTYRTFASSVYVFRDDSWKLAFHQQTPIDAN